MRDDPAMSSAPETSITATPQKVFGDEPMLVWRTPMRHYRAIVQRDLFGNWEFMRIWGGRGSGRGGSKVLPVADREAGLRLMQQQALRRHARGYVLDRVEPEREQASSMDAMALDSPVKPQP